MAFLPSMFVLCFLLSLTPGPPPPPMTLEDVRDTKVKKMGAALKYSLRDPGSVQWLTIYANDRADIICFEYRAKNGFGGFNIEQTAVVNEEFGDWQKYCSTPPANNLTHLKRYIY